MCGVVIICIWLGPYVSQGTSTMGALAMQVELAEGAQRVRLRLVSCDTMWDRKILCKMKSMHCINTIASLLAVGELSARPRSHLLESAWNQLYSGLS